MSQQPTEEDVVDVVNRRTTLLDTLLQQPTEKRQLVEELDISRSTVDRGVRELCALGFAEYDDGRYAATPLGAFIGSLFFDLQERVEIAMRLEPFLQHVEPEWFDVDLSWLRDATVITADSTDSFGAFDAHVETVRETAMYRALLPSVGREPMKMKYRFITEHDSAHQVVVGPSVARQLRSKPFIDLVRQMADTGRVRIYRTEQPIPIYLGIFDDAVQFGICDPNGVPYVLMETGDDDAMAWADKKYETYRRESTILVDETTV